MTKFKFFMDFEKEEAWLDEMAADGWRLERVVPTFGKYVFTRLKDDEFCPKVRIDLRIVPRKEKYEYMELFNESGWKNICSSNINGQQYFRQISEGSSDSIFSDKSSEMQRDKRWGNLLAILSTFLFVACTFGIIFSVDAARNAYTGFYIYFIVITSISFAVGIIFLLMGDYFLRRYKRRSTEAITFTETDGTIKGDRTAGLVIRNIIISTIVSVGAGIIVGALLHFFQPF